MLDLLLELAPGVMPHLVRSAAAQQLRQLGDGFGVLLHDGLVVVCKFFIFGYQRFEPRDGIVAILPVLINHHSREYPAGPHRCECFDQLFHQLKTTPTR